VQAVDCSRGSIKTGAMPKTPALTHSELVWIQVEAKLDAILEVSKNLLLKMDSSHPLVPKRKLTASQVQRGKIYNRPDCNPQTVAAEMLRLHTDDNMALSAKPQRSPLASHKVTASEIAKKKVESVAAIRIDAALASIFEFEHSVASAGKDTTTN
jgi:hypothetical protein